MIKKIKQKYINRDISWLSFNGRVLDEAKDQKLPIYERLKFLAIYSSNLDEFYKVRVASYRRTGSSEDVKESGDQAGEVLKQILEIVDRQQNELGNVFWKELVPGLQKAGIKLYQKQRLSQARKDFISTYFLQEVLPYLQPLLLVKGKIMPFLQDDAIYLAVKMYRNSAEVDRKKDKRKARYAIVNIPSRSLPRFIELPSSGNDHMIVFLDDIIRMNFHTVFPGYEIDSSFSIKISRDADLGIDDEFTGDLPEKISRSLVKRKTGVPARFLYDQLIPETFLEFIRQSLRISKKELVPGGRYHNFSDLFTFPNPLSPSLESRSLKPHERIPVSSTPSLLDLVENQDLMLHFPYQSYQPFIRFLNEAAIDPGVKAIKTTQYRVAPDSAVVNALINARRNGKKVTVFVELKARFDESANLRFSRQMEQEGIRIIYSIPGLKVHAKVALVLGKPKGSSRGDSAFLSTGNFNEKTARIYADHGLFTSDTDIISELKLLFGYLEKQKQKPVFNQLLVAQFNMKLQLLRMIDFEIKEAQAGRKGRILLKMNGLDNRKIIDKLYEAGKKGVQVDLIVRGICCMVPGRNFSPNITITRIVDRFLEHARVYVFHHGGDTLMYMASADLMNRNLNRRIEVGFPVKVESIKQEVLTILQMQLEDNTKARVLDAEHNNLKKESAAGSPQVRAQIDTYHFLGATQLVK